MQTITKLRKLKGDFKNLVIGFLLGLCLMLAVAAASSNNDNLGTYQCCPAGDDSTAVFIVNTQTGQTWRLSRNDHYDFGRPQERKSIRSNIVPRVD
jgi:hypothetical protein